jgi:hypothetical protein
MSLKAWLQDYPGNNATHLVADGLILVAGLVVTVRLWRGLPFPAGYEAWLVFLAALVGVTTGGMLGKRLTDITYKAAGTSPVTVPVMVEAPSTVSVTTAPAAELPPLPPEADTHPDRR